MGGVELLSREGEIAIAKRIEAGKDLMINALTQSPIVGKKMFEWKEKLEKGELLIRDIIDIDSTYEDFESEDQNSSKQKKLKEKPEEEPEKNCWIIKFELQWIRQVVWREVDRRKLRRFLDKGYRRRQKAESLFH